MCRTNPDDVIYSGAPVRIPLVGVNSGKKWYRLLTLDMQRPLESFWSVHELDLGTVYRFGIPMRFQLVSYTLPCRLRSSFSGDEAADPLYNATHSSPIESVMIPRPRGVHDVR